MVSRPFVLFLTPNEVVAILALSVSFSKRLVCDNCTPSDSEMLLILLADEGLLVLHAYEYSEEIVAWWLHEDADGRLAPSIVHSLLLLEE